jgi:hypothetical protein
MNQPLYLGNLRGSELAKKHVYTEATLYFSACRGTPRFITSGSRRVLRLVTFWPLCKEWIDSRNDCCAGTGDALRHFGLIECGTGRV